MVDNGDGRSPGEDVAPMVVKGDGRSPDEDVPPMGLVNGGAVGSAGPSIGPMGVGGASGVIRDAAAVEAGSSGAAAGDAGVPPVPGRMVAEPALGASAAACRKASSM
jgi:hypothetical protein